MTQKSVYCIIVTYNAMKWVTKCFTSIRKADYPIKTIVIDNGSTDGTQDTIKEKFSEVELIQSNINLGFGKANNIGIKRAISQGADFIFLLNQDAYLYKGSLKALIGSFDRDLSIGVVSPVHLAGDQKNLDIGFYDYIRPENTPQLLGDLFLNNLKPLYSTNFVNAAAWIIKSEVIKKIGIFHPIFDHYGEDEEFIYRLKLNNFCMCVYTNFHIVHDRPQKFNSSSSRFKQVVILNYCTGKLNFLQVQGIYFKLFIRNLIKLNIASCKDTLLNWIDINKKIYKKDKYKYRI